MLDMNVEADAGGGWFMRQEEHWVFVQGASGRGELPRYA